MRALIQRCLSIGLSTVIVASNSLFSLPVSRAADDSIVINQAQVQLTGDGNANMIVNTGDQITITVDLNNADGGCGGQATTVVANLTAYGGTANENVPCMADNGGVNDVFVLNFNVQDAAGAGIDVPANQPQSQITVVASDADENDGAGNPNPQAQTNPIGDGGIDNSLGVDTIAPQVSDGAINGALALDNGVLNTAGVGDQILVTYSPLTDGITDPNPAEIRAQLAGLGGSANQLLFDDGTNGDVANGDGTFSFLLSITEGAGGGIDAAGLQFGVVMEDDAGNNSGVPVVDSNTFTIDNVSPTVSDGNITSTIQLDQFTPGVAEVNDVIRTTWNNSAGGDNNSDLSNIVVDLSAFGGGAAQPLFDDGSNGDQTNGDGIFTFDFTVTGGNVNASNLNATVSATDDGGNQTNQTDSSNLSVNNISGSSSRRSTSTQAAFDDQASLDDDEEVVDAVDTDESPTATTVTATDDSTEKDRTRYSLDDLSVNTIEVDFETCDCQNERTALEQFTYELYNSYSSYDYQLSCINPICLNISLDSLVSTEDTPAEATYREAFRDKLDASRAVSEALDARIEAEKAHEEARGEYGEAHFDYLLVRNEGKKAGESQGDYLDRLRTAIDNKVEAQRKLEDKQRDLRQANDNYYAAQNEHQQAKEAFEAIEEDEDLLDQERRNEIIDEELNPDKKKEKQNTATPFVLGCVDPICEDNSTVLPSYRQTWTALYDGYDRCLNRCELPGHQVETYKAPRFEYDGLHNIQEAEKAETKDGKPFSLPVPNLGDPNDSNRFYFEEDALGPYAYDGLERIPRGSAFANDIADHPEEPFISALYLENHVQGVNNSENFEPDTTLTRAALLKIAFNIFDIRVPRQSSVKPFKDVPIDAWFAVYFLTGSNFNVIRGYGPESLPLIEREARPAQEVNRVEALKMFIVTGAVDTSSGSDFQSNLVDEANPDWWADIWKWAEMNGVVKEGDKPDDQITRAEAAAMAVKIKAIKQKEPCNCLQELVAWKKAEEEAQKAEDAASEAETEAEESEKDAKSKEAASKKADQTLDDLQKYKDDSSSATGEDGEKITTGDLRLLELANKAIHDQWINGEITAQEASEAWEGTNKDKLEELRKQIDDQIAKARDDSTAADKEAKDARSKADTAASKAKQAREESNKAKKRAEELKKAYDDCVEKCKELKKKLAEERRKAAIRAAKAAAERRKKAAAERRRRDAERKRQEEQRRKAEERRQRAQEAAAAAEAAKATQGGGSVPSAAKDPCKEKLAQAIAARGAQVAKTRPGDVAEFEDDPSSAGRTGRTLTVMVANGIKVAAKTALKGGATALQVAKAVSSALPSLYKLWVDYVGDAIKEAGTRIINNRRVCNTIKFSTNSKCGYELFPPGQVVYYEKDANGNYQVLVMGPGDKVTKGQCK